jgi:hypothetical protein
MSKMATLALLRGNNQAWKDHLRACYEKTTAEHSGSPLSWAKTLFRTGERVDTAVGVAGQATAAVGAATAAAGLGGAAIPAAVVGVTGASAAGAVTLFALPVIASLAAIGVWGYNKHESHQVNKEIWKWWHDHCGDTWELDAKETVKLETAKKWLGWFGDEGIGNMEHLDAKLKEAKSAFDNKFKAVQSSRNDLIGRIQLAMNIKDRQQKIAAIQRLYQEEEGLADKYTELGKDLQYITYRLQRIVMYHQMLDLTVRSLILHMKDPLAKLAKQTRDAVQKQTDSYYALLTNIVSLPPLPKA